MSTSTLNPQSAPPVPARREALGFLVPLGRILFAAIFLGTAMNHFNPQTAAFVAQSGVPRAEILVPLAGVVAILGGLSVAIGFRARLGALLLAGFLIPVSVLLHNFWAVPDPTAAQLQQAMFMKNVSMLGGALLIMYFGAGPFSLDARFRK